MTTDKKSSFLLKSYVYLWLLYIAYGISLGILSVWFPEIINKEYEQTAIMDMARNNPFQLFILACIFAPIVEEMMFRTLIKPSHSDLILCICSWPIFLGIRLLPESAHWLINLAFSGVLLFTIHTLLKQLIPENKTVFIRQKISQFAVPILIMTSLIFGLVHISNYVDNGTFTIALIILIIPQVIAGFMLGIVKLKNKGIGWPMILHFMNNLVPVLILILTRTH